MAEASDQTLKATSVVSKSLAPGERLLWAGRPRQGFIFRQGMVLPFLILIPMAPILLVGFLCAKTAVSLSDALAIAGMLVPVALFLNGDSLFDLLLRMQLFYGVTDRRILIISRIMPMFVASIDLKTVHKINLIPKRGKRGILNFHTHPTQHYWPDEDGVLYGAMYTLMGRTFRWSSWDGAKISRIPAGLWNVLPRFEHIEEPEKVLTIVEDAIKKAGAANGN